ncbi:MAG: rhomboid family intramembrane serine protease [Chloroflexota bacterium]|nr:rhomboid family intramembrane serine protease [Chloroflexota bacterium]
MIPLRDANPTRRRPIVTYLIIALCCLAFGLELWIQASDGEGGLERLFLTYGLVPGDLTGATGTGVAGLGQAMVALFSHLFLHGGWLHLGGNMLYLWIFGNNIEDRFGRLRFLGFYLIGGLVAALSQVWIAPGSTTPLIGASGAIAAVLGAYLVLYPGARVLSLVFLVFFYQLLNVPAVIVLGLWFVLQLLSGVGSLSASADGGVAFFAHIGGFVAGLVIGLLVRSVGGWSGRAGQPSGRVGVG